MDSYRFYHNHGRCQTYRPAIDKEGPIPGERRGYKFQFVYLEGGDPTDMDEDERMLNGGMDVYIHDASEWFTGLLLMGSLRPVHAMTNSCFGRESASIRERRALVRAHWLRSLHQAE